MIQAFPSLFCSRRFLVAERMHQPGPALVMRKRCKRFAAGAAMVPQVVANVRRQFGDVLKRAFLPSLHRPAAKTAGQHAPRHLDDRADEARRIKAAGRRLKLAAPDLIRRHVSSTTMDWTSRLPSDPHEPNTNHKMKTVISHLGDKTRFIRLAGWKWNGGA